MIKIQVTENAKVLYQQWSGDNAGEPAIVMTKYSDSIELRQEDNAILISCHEVKAFIKELQSLIK